MHTDHTLIPADHKMTIDGHEFMAALVACATDQDQSRIIDRLSARCWSICASATGIMPKHVYMDGSGYLWHDTTDSGLFHVMGIIGRPLYLAFYLPVSEMTKARKLADGLGCHTYDEIINIIGEKI